ncbi:hypothetical protein KDD17_01880 [Sulfitobacter albidus]|uniref:Uncharacterized protein n=1 Tax=Sulfitobacter albidus TaxID=2829501 RepID=A0A975PMW3_9RHOB|nr:hypothetical protein [Sulfitobacter albidus]QUJ76836.1 hypothetical protein KDD17_01880 [Sulfitobacter albidus]
MTRRYAPMLMGVAMAPMLLMMLHSALTGEDGRAGTALLVFAGVHVLIFLVLVGAGLLAARMSGLRSKALARLHRPSPRHLTGMLASATATAGLIHLILHGGV